MSDPAGKRRPPAGEASRTAGLRERIEKILIVRYAPPCIAFGGDGEILLDLGSALARLGAAEGAAGSLWKALPADLAHPLQALVDRADAGPTGAVTGTVFVGAAGSRRPIPVVIQKLDAGAQMEGTGAGSRRPSAPLHLLIVEDPEWRGGIDPGPERPDDMAAGEESERTAADAGSNLAGPSDPEAPRHRRALPRVLVIDPHRDKAETMRVFLELKGYEVAVAHARDSGIEKARQFRPGVVVCGLEVSGPLAGSELPRFFRDDPKLRDVLLVAVNSQETEKGAALASAAGFDGHLRKPLDPAALLQWLEELPRRTWQS